VVSGNSESYDELTLSWHPSEAPDFDYARNADLIPEGQNPSCNTQCDIKFTADRGNTQRYYVRTGGAVIDVRPIL